MIIALRSFQDTGKTSLGIKIIKKVVEIGSRYPHGFRYSDIVANVHLPNWVGSHSINNNQMRAYVKSMVTKGLKHKIVFMDEADRLFPARFWQHAEQTEALIGLWQDYKLFNIIIYTAHEGTGIDVILRSVTQIEVTPAYDAFNNCTHVIIYNAIIGKVFKSKAENISDVFDDYDRWEVIAG